jgi:nucleotide-binding universal stress UspA family protein
MLAIRTILHPTDFSEHSAQALRLACVLARDHRAKLILLHVAEPAVIASSGVLMPAPPAPFEYNRAGLEARLAALASTEPDVRIECRVVFGGPGEEIVAAAQDGCDLIVMGTHGRRGLGRLVLGSVAEQVMRRSPCPVLAVKVGDTSDRGLRIRRILHPTDFSDQSALALHLASWLAREYEAPLTVVHVLPPATVFDETLVERPENIDRTAANQLAAIQPTVPGVTFETLLEEGDAAEKIASSARAMAADLIVMGTHGRKGLDRLLMGSVAEAVLRAAPCAVLTVKTPLAGTWGTAAPRELELSSRL